MLGRANASRRFVVWGVIPIGGLAGGALGSSIGLRPTLLIGAIGAALSFLPLLASPLRRIPRRRGRGGVRLRVVGLGRRSISTYPGAARQSAFNPAGSCLLLSTFADGSRIPTPIVARSAARRARSSSSPISSPVALARASHLARLRLVSGDRVRTGHRLERERKVELLQLRRRRLGELEASGGRGGARARPGRARRRRVSIATRCARGSPPYRRATSGTPTRAPRGPSRRPPRRCAPASRAAPTWS